MLTQQLHDGAMHTLDIIGGKRERAPYLIICRKFVSPSVRVSILAD